MSPGSSNYPHGKPPTSRIELAAAPSSMQLFIGFLTLGLISFGGALPHARRVMVEERRWLSADDFMELLGLCQFLPGGNIINLSVAVGMRFRGIGGALAAMIGLIAGPSAIVILLGIVYERTQDNPYVKHLFSGLAAAAAGLLVAMAIKVLMPLLPRWKYSLASPKTPSTADHPTVPAPRIGLAALIAVVGFVAIALFRVPLLLTMVLLVPISIVATITLEKKGKRP